MTPQKAREMRDRTKSLKLTMQAYEMETYLRDKGCIRTSLEQRPKLDFPTATRPELVEMCDIRDRKFTKVKRRAMAVGIPISLSSRGHYLGLEGEMYSNLEYCRRQAEGHQRAIGGYLVALEESQSLEAAEKYARRHLAITLSRLPSQLMAWGFRLPAALERRVLALIDSG